MVTHPRAADSFYVAILSAIMLGLIGVLVICKLAARIVHDPDRRCVLVAVEIS
jgi:hypothetical protein